MNPNTSRTVERRFRYLHPEQRAYHRAYGNLLARFQKVPINHLLFLTIRFPYERLGTKQREAEAWKLFAREVINAEDWIVDWARVFEGIGEDFHVHVILRANQSVGSFIKKRCEQGTCLIPSAPIIADFQRQLLRQVNTEKLFRFHFRRISSLAFLCGYLTKEQKQRGKKKESRCDWIKGRRLVEFRRDRRKSASNSRTLRAIGMSLGVGKIFSAKDGSTKDAKKMSRGQFDADSCTKWLKTRFPGF